MGFESFVVGTASPSFVGGYWENATLTTPTIVGLATFDDRVLVNDRAYIRGAYAYGADASPNGLGRGGLVVTTQGEVAVGLAAATASVTDALSNDHVMQVTYQTGAANYENTLPLDVYLTCLSKGLGSRTGLSVLLTGTTDSSTASTMTDAAGGFPTGGTPVDGVSTLANTHWVEILTGTGSGQYRLITANTATEITVSPVWDVNPGAGATYRITREYDTAAISAFAVAGTGAIGITRGAQIHGLRYADSYGSKVQGMELAVETAEAGSAEDFAVGLYCISYATHLPGGVGVRANTGLWVGGPSGQNFDRYLGCYSGLTDASKVAEILYAGHFNTVGKGTFGTLTTGTSILTVKQSADDFTGGFQTVRTGANTQYLAAYVNGSNVAVLHALNPSNGLAGTLGIGTTTGTPAVAVSGVIGLTASLLQLAITSGSTMFEVLATGAVRIQGTQVLTTQQTGIAALTIAAGTANNAVADVGGSFDQTTLNNNFADVATKINEIRTILNAHGLTTTV